MNAIRAQSLSSRSLRTSGDGNFIGGRLYQILNFLTQHCYEPIGIEDLARASNLSRRGLHKAFRRYIGQSPGRALRRMRIERAKGLLANSNLNQKIIAEVCGYRSLNSFWVSFRAIVGQSPGEFRCHAGKK
ncbi:MAG TPA: helix-turn-helix transcriptional regulator [Candidatus Sulfotelmatobacter sp.]|nr:helix-turn-helix transcriptional regulator [Candidatus Sulfotelmatobacter sp.]